MADDENDGPIHEHTTVLDLPQLHSRPSAPTLLSTLSHLTLSLPSWDAPNHENAKTRSINTDGLASYLTRIISSPLNWIANDSDKEAIWDTASKRLSERSGRSAMPSLSRTFKIPIPLPDSTEPGTENDIREIEIEIYEPSLTGDNLGHKTWIASYLLAKRLPLLLPQHFSCIDMTFDSLRHRHKPRRTAENKRPRILELGAGTGLVGLAASGLVAAADIHLTDLAPILPNLKYNVQQNASLVDSTGSTITARVLDWSVEIENTAVMDEEKKYDIILAADSLYAPEHSNWVVRTIGRYLKRGQQSRVFVELPLRPGSSYPEDFRRRMQGEGFVVVEEGEESGVDDWEDGEGEGVEVRCWFSVWAWV